MKWKRLRRGPAMNLNDIGSWCVVWLTRTSPTQVVHSFFADRKHAIEYRDQKGGELYLKQSDGSLKRNG